MRRARTTRRPSATSESRTNPSERIPFRGFQNSSKCLILDGYRKEISPSRPLVGQATTEALQKVDSRGKTAPDAHTARLEAELERMRHVVAEITAENLELKKT